MTGESMVGKLIKAAKIAIAPVWVPIKGCFHLGSHFCEKRIRAHESGKGYQMGDIAVHGGLTFGLYGIAQIVKFGGPALSVVMAASAKPLIVTAAVAIGPVGFLLGSAIATTAVGMAFATGKKFCQSSTIDDKFIALKEKLLAKYDDFKNARAAKAEAAQQKTYEEAHDMSDKKKSGFWENYKELSMHFNTGGVRYGIPPIYAPVPGSSADPAVIKAKAAAANTDAQPQNKKAL